ncbi:MAG: hypothetical protein BYD32DRAFT_459208 [Podila humilis]|nr:MAG: hypothetical protein BYD32DRAFT_459208 [Podila humilis]
MFGHQDCHDQVYGGKTHHSKWSHELIAGAAACEAMKKHEAGSGLDSLDRQRAKRETEEQASALYDQQYGN